MELNFDIRGYLKPYTKVELSLNEFKENFVDSFEENSSRIEIFANLEKYIHDFEIEITPDFKLWINGSFATNKRNPKDLDLVTIIDHKVAEAKYHLLKSKFLNKKALVPYKIDAYIVRVFPSDHKDHSKSVSDLLYWEHWFGNSKKNRAKKRFPKGFIELNFKKN